MRVKLKVSWMRRYIARRTYGNCAQFWHQDPLPYLIRIYCSLKVVHPVGWPSWIIVNCLQWYLQCLLFSKEMLPECGWACSHWNMPQCNHLANATDRVREIPTTGPGRHGDDLQDCGTWGPRSGEKCNCAPVYVQRVQRDLCPHQISSCLPTSCCHEWPCPRTSNYGLPSHIIFSSQHPTGVGRFLLPGTQKCTCLHPRLWHLLLWQLWIHQNHKATNLGNKGDWHIWNSNYYSWE